MTEERARYLMGLASELICRVRDVDPERNRIWLESLSAEDRWDLLFVLAASLTPQAQLRVRLDWVRDLAVADG